MPSPLSCGLATRAHRLALALLFQSHRPLEHREACGLRLSAPAPGLHRLVGHELRPGEQRSTTGGRLRGLVMVAVAVGVAVDARLKLDRRPRCPRIQCGAGSPLASSRVSGDQRLPPSVLGQFAPCSWHLRSSVPRGGRA